jgi:hypothetical protein
VVVSLISEAGDFEAGNKGRQMGIKMTRKIGKNHGVGGFVTGIQGQTHLG